MNMTLSLLPVVLSFVITIGILYVLYTKFFIKYMNLKGDGKDKIISYSLLIGILTFGLGLTTVFNELFFVQFNNSTIQSKNIERGIFTLLFYPLVFWSLGFILHKVFKKQPRDVQLSEGTGFKLNTNTYLIGGGILGLILVISMMSNNDNYSTTSSISSSNKNEKEFKISSCLYCNKLTNQCNEGNLIQSFIVSTSKVVLILKNGSIMDTSNMSDMKCSIIPSKNFMFDCNSMTWNSGIVSGTSYKFDGKSNFLSETYIDTNKKVTTDGSVSCKVR